MIPVRQQPEPTLAADGFDFEAKVRRPGHNWLSRRGFLSAAPLPPGTKLPTYWRECLAVLHAKYSGICSYLCVYLEQAIGGVSVDHFAAKSTRPALAFEWSNYRLASVSLNSHKNVFDDVLDPFTLAPETFHLELVTGHIYPNPRLDSAAAAAATATIDRLGLHGFTCRKMRVRWFDDWRTGGVSTAVLQRDSPFVWYEANRQGLL